MKTKAGTLQQVKPWLPRHKVFGIQPAEQQQQVTLNSKLRLTGRQCDQKLSAQWRLDFHNWSPAGDSRFVRQAVVASLGIHSVWNWLQEVKTTHLSIPTKIMSEYYKKIGSTLCLITQKLMYFDRKSIHINIYQAPYCFSGFFQKHGIAAAFQHHVFFVCREKNGGRIYVSFYGLEMKILPELRLMENLNPSSVMNDENVDLATLAEGE